MVEIIKTYSETAEYAVEPRGVAHENERLALPRSIEGRLIISLLEVSKL
jgi:hypothetical protein